MKALFLGAGASYDFGLPLVWELTAELRNWLTAEKVDWINDRWKSQGGGRSQKTLEFTKRLLVNKDLHYEAILGAFEVAINRERDSYEREQLHAQYSWLLQMICHMLNERQIKNKAYISGIVSDYYGIQKMADESRPLWVFSLNHDVNFEIIAAAYGIPVKSGFDEEITIPERAPDGEIIGRLKFKKISRSSLNGKKYDLFKKGEYGVNLVKLHGALDVFASGDDLSYLKLQPDENSVVGIIEALDRANMNLRCVPFLAVTNEIAYTDDFGEIQFLRRTLLSGAHKFTGKVSQLAPPEFLSLFESNINFSSEMICIGYSFGDHHIDSCIKNWLSFSSERKIVIVNPAFSSVRDIPVSYLHLSEQIEFQKIGFCDFILNLDSSKDSKEVAFRRWLRRQARIRMSNSIQGLI
ncbi:MAG: hypothetical protein WAZ48_04210 [Lysobacteraceae bacterium]